MFSLPKLDLKPHYFEEKFVKCQDGVSVCAENATCCNYLGRKSGCCHFQNGVCCKDHKHCCPSGHRCDLEKGGCQKLTNVTDSSKHENVQIIKPILSDLISSVPKNQYTSCPGALSVCGLNESCCKWNDGYGCCPFKDGVCCEGNPPHCCPANFKCDSINGRCAKQLGSDHSNIVPIIKKKIETNNIKSHSTKFAKQNRFSPFNKTRCPDPFVECENNETCCRLSDTYACCPLPNAVCCSDNLHCCPEDTVCDLVYSMCRKKRTVQTHTPINKAAKQDLFCPNAHYKCPEGSTCCKSNNVTNSWSCCPYENAICCGDGFHCCPSGSYCDIEKGQCILPELPQPDLPHAILTPFSTPAVTTKCSSAASCSSEHTCCALDDGSGFGCCPLENGTCCGNNKCCPSGTICHPDLKNCVKVLSKSSYETVPHPATKLSTPNAELSATFQNYPVGLHDTAQWCGKCGSSGCCPTLDNKNWLCCAHFGGHCCNDGRTCCPSDSDCTGDGQCKPKSSQVEIVSFATRLIPTLEMTDKQFLQSNKSVLGISPALKSRHAGQNVFLLTPRYRELKRIRHNVCGSSIFYCRLQEQCCQTRKNSYSCIPESTQCCKSSNGGTYCPQHKHCIDNGAYCA